MFEFKFRGNGDAFFVRVHSFKAKYITEKGKSQTFIPQSSVFIGRVRAFARFARFADHKKAPGVESRSFSEAAPVAGRLTQFDLESVGESLSDLLVSDVHLFVREGPVGGTEHERVGEALLALADGLALKDVED